MTIRSLLPAMVLVSATAFPQVVPMTNDECSSAIPVVTGINPGGPAGLSGHVYSNVGATPSATIGFCQAMLTDVWFATSRP